MKANNLLGDRITDQSGQQNNETLNNLGFGDGTDGKKAGNHDGVTLDVTFDVSPKDIEHKMDRTPKFAWPLRPGDVAGAVLQWVSADSEKVTLGCSVIGAKFKIYVE